MMVNKYWNLKEISYDTMLEIVECYGVIIGDPVVPPLISV